MLTGASQWKDHQTKKEMEDWPAEAPENLQNSGGGDEGIQVRGNLQTVSLTPLLCPSQLELFNSNAQTKACHKATKGAHLQAKLPFWMLQEFLRQAENMNM